MFAKMFKLRDLFDFIPEKPYNLYEVFGISSETSKNCDDY
jgi:hypothetical protein